MTYIEPLRSSYSQRFKNNLKAYRAKMGISFIVIALISMTMCYYILNYLLFANKGEPVVLTLLSLLAVAIQGITGIALGAIRNTNK